MRISPVWTGVFGFAWVAAPWQASAAGSATDLSWRPPPLAHDEELVERVFVDDRDPPKPKALEQERGFLLYRRPATALVFPNSVPRAAERVATLAAYAAPGECRPLTLAVYALQDLSRLRVHLGALTHEDGVALEPDRTEVRVARCLFKRTTHYAGPGEFMYMPTWLAEHSEEELSASRSEWFWILIRVPAAARPGRYNGRIEVTTGTAQAAVPVHLEVLPITLPDPGVNVGFYDSPTPEKLEQQRAHGMTSVGWHGNSGVTLRQTADGVAVEVAGSSMDRVLTAYAVAGFTSPLLWLMGDDVWAWCTQQAPAESAECAALYVAALTGIRDYAASRKWPDIIVQPDDECPGHPDRMARSERRLPLIQKAGFQTEMDHYLAYHYAENAEWVARTMPHVDVITSRYWPEGRLGQAPWADLAERVTEAGKELWTYNITACHMFPQPTSMRFSTGWFFRTEGASCRGMFFWAYASRQQDPYNDFDGACSDFCYWYPPDPERGLSGGPSIDLVCMSEGLTDLRYVRALETRIAEQQRGARVRRARNLLRRLLNSFNFRQPLKRRIEGTKSAWEYLEERDGIRIARGNYIYPNGWDAADYDNARREIAAQILRLQGVPTDLP